MPLSNTQWNGISYRVQAEIDYIHIPVITATTSQVVIGTVDMFPGLLSQTYRALFHIWFDGLGHPGKNRRHAC